MGASATPPKVCGYVYRGNVNTLDFSRLDLTTDGNAHELDLSGFIPVNARAVVLYVAIQDDLVNQEIIFKRENTVGETNVSRLATVIANEYFSNDIIVACNNQRIWYTAANITWLAIDIMVKAWFR